MQPFWQRRRWRRLADAAAASAAELRSIQHAKSAAMGCLWRLAMKTASVGNQVKRPSVERLAAEAVVAAVAVAAKLGQPCPASRRRELESRRLQL